MNATRREFLQTIVVAAGMIGAGPALAAAIAPAPFRPSRNFPQGVASGDPKPDSVILWTRTIDPTGGDGDVPVILQLADRESFVPRRILVDVPLTAQAVHNRCLRVKVTGLDPYRTYFYRFLTADGASSSPVGRHRTAPQPDDDVAIRFAFASCQDYIGRYYNSYLPLLAPENADIDFLVHLGDFIYETTGDPAFQSSGGPRTIRFDDEAGAIALGDAGDPFYAARSLSNYRQLHRRYRSDAVLQRVLARFPLVAIWDDHEFSDDSWRATATYFDGARPEHDGQRRRNAERAWLEFMPIDDTDGTGAPADIIDTGPERLFPNTRIFRNLRFGKAVNLALTDYRSYRADHLVAEDAFPGTIVAVEASIAALYAELGRDSTADAAELQPYVPWNALPPLLQGALRAIVAQEYANAGYVGDAAEKAAAVLTGDLAIPVLNRRLAFASLPPIPTDGMPKGLSYEMLGKATVLSDFGARYAVVQKWFDVYARLRGLDAEVVYGKPQTTLLQQDLSGADVHWNVVASSVSNTAMILDLAQNLDGIAMSDALRSLLTLIRQTPLGTRITMNVDQWDGFPLRRDSLLRFYRSLGNVVLIAGDIHSSWVTDHSTNQGRLVEFTGPAISSSSFGQLILGAIASTAATLGLPPELIRQLPALLPELIQALQGFLFDRTPTSEITPLRQEIAFVDADRNGIVVVDADAQAMRATYYLLPAQEVLVNAYDQPQVVLAKMETCRFEVSKSSGLHVL